MGPFRSPFLPLQQPRRRSNARCRCAIAGGRRAIESKVAALGAHITDAFDIRVQVGTEIAIPFGTGRRSTARRTARAGRAGVYDCDRARIECGRFLLALCGRAAMARVSASAADRAVAVLVVIVDQYPGAR